MNAVDILHYGHRTFAAALEGVPEADWLAEGVCGVWSVKDITAHLASYEVALVEVLGRVVDPTLATPLLDKWFAVDVATLNDSEVERRQSMSAESVWGEYLAAHTQNMDLIVRIPVAKRREVGLLPWYGAEYDLEDFLVYRYYGHKREHSAQINVYKDTLGAG